MIIYDDRTDSMNVVRGLVLGILLSLPFWAVLAAGIATLL